MRDSALLFPGESLMSALHIALLTPTALPHPTGNAMTAERWRRLLSGRGSAVKVIETIPITAHELIAILDSFHPDLIHAHHLSRAGHLLLDPKVQERYGSLPLVVSPAGTDINNIQWGRTEREAVEKVCRKARFIVAQSTEMSDRLRELLPEIAVRIRYVAKSYFWLGDAVCSLRSTAGLSQGDLLFFMPAGIRPVKGNIECLLAMEEVHSANNRIHAVFAGPELDRTYADRFQKEIRRLHSFAQWMEIPPQAMRSAYAESDVVLNHSRSEGVSNSLLEAIAAEKPVLASNVTGNLWLTHSRSEPDSCVLFDLENRADFVVKALRFADDFYRASIARASCSRASMLPHPSEEAQGLLDLYQLALNSA
jgi:L-malate glycosyltransferase